MTTIKELQKKIHDIEEHHKAEIAELNRKFEQRLADLTEKYEEKVDKLTEIISNVQKDIPSLISQAVEKAIKASAESMKNIIEDVAKQTAQAVEKSLNNSWEKKEKQKNLVVVGMSERDEGSDWNRVYEMAKHAGIADPHSAIKTIFRDGSSGRKTPAGLPVTRILKVRFTNKNYRLAFLKTNYRDLGVDFSRLYVRPDLTYDEREMDRALKAELQQRRADTGNLNLIIRNGQIIDKTLWNHGTIRGNERSSQ